VSVHTKLEKQGILTLQISQFTFKLILFRVEYFKAQNHSL